MKRSSDYYEWSYKHMFILIIYSSIGDAEICKACATQIASTRRCCYVPSHIRTTKYSTLGIFGKIPNQWWSSHVQNTFWAYTHINACCCHDKIPNMQIIFAYRAICGVSDCSLDVRAWQQRRLRENEPQRDDHCETQKYKKKIANITKQYIQGIVAAWLSRSMPLHEKTNINNVIRPHVRVRINSIGFSFILHTANSCVCVVFMTPEDIYFISSVVVRNKKKILITLW